MEKLSPKEFAALLRKTQEIREVSWVNTGEYGRYTVDLDQAATQACAALGYSGQWARIASVTIFPGYCDVWDWCEEVER